LVGAAAARKVGARGQTKEKEMDEELEHLAEQPLFDFFTSLNDANKELKLNQTTLTDAANALKRQVLVKTHNRHGFVEPPVSPRFSTINRLWKLFFIPSGLRLRATWMVSRGRC
jgi:hypothetical protein